MHAMLSRFDRSDHLHFLPVIRKFFSTIKTDNVGSRQSRSLGAALGPTDCNGKAIA